MYLHLYRVAKGKVSDEKTALNLKVIPVLALLCAVMENLKKLEVNEEFSLIFSRNTCCVYPAPHS
jgi:hypothetical protein